VVERLQISSDENTRRRLENDAEDEIYFAMCRLAEGFGVTSIEDSTFGEKSGCEFEFEDALASSSKMIMSREPLPPRKQQRLDLQ